MGNYFYGHRGPIASALLVRLLGEFGVGPVAARNALSRVTRRGLLTMTRTGRSTSYALTQEAHDNHAARLHEFLCFGARTPEGDGTWTVVLFSVPEDQRALRHVVRSRLVRLHFGMLYDGVWVRPGPVHELLADAMRALAPDFGPPGGNTRACGKVTVLAAASTADWLGAGDPIVAFPLADLARRYRTFTDRHAPLRERRRRGEIGPAEALRVRTTVMDEWRHFADDDRVLPAELLPADWPLGSARHTFVELYDGLADLAGHRLRALITAHDPELAATVRPITSAEMSAVAVPVPGQGPRTGADQLTAPIGRRTT